jgi:hypothetical protein
MSTNEYSIALPFELGAVNDLPAAHECDVVWKSCSEFECDILKVLNSSTPSLAPQLPEEVWWQFQGFVSSHVLHLVWQQTQVHNRLAGLVIVRLPKWKQMGFDFSKAVPTKCIHINI